MYTVSYSISTEANGPTEIKFYYTLPSNKNFNEANSQAFTINIASNTPYDGVYDIYVPFYEKILLWRFDLGNRPDNIRVNKLLINDRIVDQNSINFNNLIFSPDLSLADYNNGEFHFISKGNDPYFVINQDVPCKSSYSIKNFDIVVIIMLLSFFVARDLLSQYQKLTKKQKFRCVTKSTECYKGSKEQYPDDLPNNTLVNFPAIHVLGLKGFKLIDYRTEVLDCKEESDLKTLARHRKIHILYGNYTGTEDEIRVCPECGSVMHTSGSAVMSLRHIPAGDDYVNVKLVRERYKCSSEQCGYSCCCGVPFKTRGYMMTEPLRKYTESLLRSGYSLKETANLTGLSINTVKNLDLARLEELYVRTSKGGRRIFVRPWPKIQVKYLAIDEFKLPNDSQHASYIIDAETGVVLWIERGKKKQVVYDFIDHVGTEWMKGVEAVVSDVNSDFEQAFKEKCPHLKVFYDHFHIIRNFNEQVVCEIRKDEQKRLAEAGDSYAAQMLKASKYIITSTQEALRSKDDAVSAHKLVSKSSQAFNKQTTEQVGSKFNKNYELLGQNELLFNADLVKSMLDYAYQSSSTEQMTSVIKRIIAFCKATENQHFLRYAKLLENYIDGVVGYTTFMLTDDKIEGIKRKIKTIRQKSYGLSDDEYFILKIMDESKQNW